MKLRIVGGFGVAWLGYTLFWWGWAQWHNTPTPLADLALPSRIANLPGDLLATSAAKNALNGAALSGPGSVSGVLAQSGLGPGTTSAGGVSVIPTAGQGPIVLSPVGNIQSNPGPILGR